MAVISFADNDIAQIISRWENRALIVPRRSEGTNYPGRLQDKGTADDQVIYSVDASEVVQGHSLQKERYANRAIDTAYTAGDFMNIALLGSGCGVWGLIDANIAAIAVGSQMHASAGGVGFFELHVAATHDTADMVKSLETHAKDATDDIICEALL